MSNQYHEPVEKLDEQTKNFTRALLSLKEEIEDSTIYINGFNSGGLQ